MIKEMHQGEHRISIASVVQKEVRSGQYVPVIIVTHRARESDFDAAMDEIQAMEIAGDASVRLRIEG